MSMEFEVNAETRSDLGKGASRRLRRQGKVPAIIYGAEKDPQMLTLDHDDLVKHLEHEAFFSHVLTINVDGKAEQAVLKDMQRHPAKPFIQHVDFLRVDASHKLRMQVPLHFLNEEKAPGVVKGGVVTHTQTEVEISCLAKDLPEFLEVDLAEVELNGSVHLSDLKLPAGVELLELTHGEDHDLPVATISLPRGAKEAAEGEEEEGEGEE